MKTFFIVIIIPILGLLKTPDKLTGVWQSSDYGIGPLYKVEFYENSKFKSTIDNRPYVDGSYQLTDKTLWLSDPYCSSIDGRYKIHFLGHGDSVHLEVENDACTGRSKAIHNRVFVKMK